MEPGQVSSGGWQRGERWRHIVRWPGCRIRGAARAVPLRPCLALKVHDVEPIGDEVAGVEYGGRASVALPQHALLVARPFHGLERKGRAWSLTLPGLYLGALTRYWMSRELTAIVDSARHADAALCQS